MGSKAWLAPHLDQLLGVVTVLHSPFFGSGKLEYYLASPPGVGPACRKPAALFLETRPGLLALLCCAWWGASGQALLLQSPPAGLSERPCRASGCLLIRPAAQQLVGKVGLLRAAAATGAEQRAASAAASDKRDCAAAGRAGPSTRSPQECIYADPPYIFPGRSVNYYGTRGRG